MSFLIASFKGFLSWVGLNIEKQLDIIMLAYHLTGTIWQEL